MLEKIEGIYNFYNEKRVAPSMRELAETIIDCAQPGAVSDADRPKLYTKAVCLIDLEAKLLKENGIIIYPEEDPMVMCIRECSSDIYVGKEYTDEQKELIALATGVYNFIKQEKIKSTNYKFDNVEEMDRIRALKEKCGDFNSHLSEMIEYISISYQAPIADDELKSGYRVLKYLNENPDEDINLKEAMQVFNELSEAKRSIERNNMINDLRLQIITRLYRNGIAIPTEKQNQEDVLVTIIRTSAELAKKGLSFYSEFQKGREDVAGVCFDIRQKDRNGLYEYNNESEFAQLTETMKSFNEMRDRLLNEGYGDTYNIDKTAAERERRQSTRDLIGNLASCVNRMFTFVEQRKEMSSKTHEPTGVKKVTPQASTPNNPQ